MSSHFSNEPMLEIFIHETSQLVEKLEQSILDSEKASCYTLPAINEIFRIMHTIKGSSSMMMFNNLAALAHAMEDLFFYLREEKPKDVDCNSLSDLVFEGVDFIKLEIIKIKNGEEADGNAALLINRIRHYLLSLKKEDGKLDLSPAEKGAEVEKQHYYISQDKPQVQVPQNHYHAVVYFEDGCEMENIRAYTIIHNLKDLTSEYVYYPEDIIENDESVQIIREKGFEIYLQTECSYQEMNDFFMKTVFLKDLKLEKMERTDEPAWAFRKAQKAGEEAYKERSKASVETALHREEKESLSTGHPSIISVNVQKLDKLMDLVGEMVIAEAMVTQNPDLVGLQLDNFQKAARQLRKITSELQDTVMSIRMVPLVTTFQKMNRIVRDMCKKLDKDVKLEIIGEETEVDKNIIEHISDPLMHLVRNALDHGIEAQEDRHTKGKPSKGTITLEAKNAGSDVVITVRDDGRGLNKAKILERARENGLLYRPEEEMTESEVFNLIFLPGFSTKEKITEFSGRGVGMDVVTKNIEAVGGTVTVDSKQDCGTTVVLKIPLTLAIIDGMNARVGKSCFTIPTTSVKQSFRPKATDILTDPDHNEMIMVRGQCLPIIRLHKLYNVQTEVRSLTEGIIIMVENNQKTCCIFADELLGQQQVVVKALPNYIKKLRHIRGLAGCTLLGDGSISLILDAAELADYR